jgi:hypothetical protein
LLNVLFEQDLDHPHRVVMLGHHLHSDVLFYSLAGFLRDFYARMATMGGLSPYRMDSARGSDPQDEAIDRHFGLLGAAASPIRAGLRRQIDLSG